MPAEKYENKNIVNSNQIISSIVDEDTEDKDGYLNMFRYIKDNQIFFKTYFKLESISMSLPTQYNIELAEKYYDNKFIDYHIEFFRAGINAIIKKWLNNNCKETPEEMVEIITSEYDKK